MEGSLCVLQWLQRLPQKGVTAYSIPLKSEELLSPGLVSFLTLWSLRRGNVLANQECISSCILFPPVLLWVS